MNAGRGVRLLTEQRSLSGSDRMLVQRWLVDQHVQRGILVMRTRPGGPNPCSSSGLLDRALLPDAIICTRQKSLGNQPWSGRLIGHVRLCHSWRGLRRLRAGQPAVRRSVGHGLPHRGGRFGPIHLDPYSDRLFLYLRQSAHRLAVPHRTGRGPERAQHQVSTRPCPGRHVVDQRDGLYPGTSARLRRLAPGGQHRLVVGRRPALLQALTGSGSRRRRSPRRGRRIARRGSAGVLGRARCVL